MNKNLRILIAGLLLGVGLTGCGVSSWYNPSPSKVVPGKTMDLSGKTPSFREGYEAGCSTARGEYQKSSKRFNSDTEYHEGWFAGRSSCQEV